MTMMLLLSLNIFYLSGIFPYIDGMHSVFLWSEWSEWGPCSVKCGLGTQIRTRKRQEPLNEKFTYNLGTKDYDYRKEIVKESKFCNNGCLNNGILSLERQKCLCRHGTSGVCCEKVFPGINFIDTMMSTIPVLSERTALSFFGKRYKRDSNINEECRESGGCDHEEVREWLQHTGSGQSVCDWMKNERCRRIGCFNRIGYQCVTTSRNCEYLHYYQVSCKDINKCRSSPCKNGGTCRNQHFDFICSCAESYYGKMCENRDPYLPNVSWVLTKTHDGLYQELLFQCRSINMTRDEDMLYQVFWFIDGKQVNISKDVNKKNLNETDLTERNGFEKLNVKVSCSFTSRKVNETAGKMSFRSDEFFAGIKVVNTPVTVERGSSGNIDIQLTVPFGCGFENNQDVNPSTCPLAIEMMIPSSSQCGDKINGLDYCGKSIQNTEWNKTHTLKIEHSKTTSYGFNTLYKVQLQTRVINTHPIWSNVIIPENHIHVVETSTSWKGLSCHAHSDPHMLTFDRISYDNQNPGTFIMYQNMDSLNNILEVQIQLTPCNKLSGPGIYCICAVAIRAARDLFVIDRCPNSKPYCGFRRCTDNILNVRKLDEMNYKIFFPTSTYLTLRLWRYQTENVIEVDIYPSASDVNKSKGLCSTLESRRLIDAKGKTIPISHRPDAFSISWRVPSNDNLLTMSDSQVNALTGTTRNNIICTCRRLENDLNEEVYCGENSVCKQKEKAVKNDNCKIRTSRSLKSRFTYVPITPNNENVHEVKRRSIPTHNQMTKIQAEHFCMNYMNESAAVRACKDIPNVNLQIAIDACVLDIQLTNTTSWAQASREGLKAVCLKEVEQNKTLHQSNGNESSTADIIQSMTCPNECSGRGQCLDGKCNCTDQYGAADCSHDLTEPPSVFGVNTDTGGLCDKLECDLIFVDGDMFLDREDLTCKLTSIKVSIDGGVEYDDISYVKGEHNTLSDIRCPFPNRREKRSVNGNIAFVTGYSVSISNNGKNFSSDRLLYILDSTCQDTVEVSGELRFVLKDGFCFIGGNCISDGTEDGSNNCYICNVQSNAFHWTLRREKEGCESKSTMGPVVYIMWTLGVITVLVLIAVTGIFISKHISKKKRTVGVPPFRDCPFSDARKQQFVTAKRAF